MKKHYFRENSKKRKTKSGITIIPTSDPDIEILIFDNPKINELGRKLAALLK